jgi:hypothetical protein
MVKFGAFDIQLVHAESHEPFKEHLKEHKTYVEVEPDAEYFLHIKKIETTETPLVLRYFIDGKDLGYQSWFKCGTSTGKDFRGIMHQRDGVEVHKALKFVKPKHSDNNVTAIGGPEISGKIEIKMYEGIFDGYRESPQGFTSDFTPETRMNLDDNDVRFFQEKVVRSAEGATTTKKRLHSTERFRKGCLLETYTLHYCTTKGLIVVGVLEEAPRSGLRENKRPATTVTPTATPVKMPEPKKIRVRSDSGSPLELFREYEFFDLTEDDHDEI